MKTTPLEIEEIIKRIEKEVKNYPIPPQLTSKLSDGSKYGNECLINLTGKYGYYYQVLALLVRYLKPRKILELGNQLGVSTVMMYYEMQNDASMVTIDIVKDQRFVPEEIFKDSRVSFEIGDSLSLETYQGTIPNNIDFLFTDTVHSYKQLKSEFEIYQHLLAENALIVIDDIGLNDKGKLFDELTFPKWDIGKFAHPSGFGLVLYHRPRTDKEEASNLLAAALASSKIWQKETESLTHLRYYINWPLVKSSLKNKLSRIPILKEFVFFITVLLRKIRN